MPAAPQLAIRSPGDVNGLLRTTRFPYVEDGWYVFLHHDPERRLSEVRLLHGLRGWREPPVFDQAAPGVHVLRLHAPEVNRIEYRLSLVDLDGEREDTADPLNPLTVDGVFGPASVALGPGYATPRHAGPPVAAARGHLSTVKGRSELFIWDPPGRDRDEPLPLLVVLDGTDYLRFAGLRHTLENLLHAGAIAPCRAVFVPPVDRLREYSANPHLPRLLTRILPERLAEVAAVPLDVPVIGIGASLGGLALLHAHATHPGLFDGLLLQSGSFFTPGSDAMESQFRHFDRITSFVESVLAGEAEVPAVPTYLTCGVGGENLDNNRAMLAALRRLGVPAELALVADAHNWTAWRDCIGPGLQALLPPH